MSALEGLAGQTSSARPARLRERAYDVIFNADLRNVGADSSHKSRDFVTKHGRCRKKIVNGDAPFQSGRDWNHSLAFCPLGSRPFSTSRFGFCFLLVAFHFVDLI
jgi:hypothetical protein